MGVSDFRMKLKAEQVPPRIGHGSNARHFCRGGHAKAGRSGGDRVEMAHPDLGVLDAIPQRILASDGKVCNPVFAALSFLNFAPKMMSQELVTVADAEDGRTAVEDGGIDIGTTTLIDAPWAAGNDDAFARAKSTGRCKAGLNLSVHAQLTNAASD